MFCRKCGKEIPDDSEFCFKCGVRVVTGERSEQSTPISLDKPDSADKQEGESGKSTDSVSASSTSSKKCPLCGKPVIRNRESCPYCGEEYTATHQSHLTPSYSVSYKDSEEYYNLKFGVTIAAWGILGVVVLICMVTGELGFLGCSSPVEYEVEYTGNGAAAIVLTAIGVSVVRAIILGIAKFKNK